VTETKEQSEAWLPGVGGIAGLTKVSTKAGKEYRDLRKGREVQFVEGEYTQVEQVGSKPHTGVFQGWPVRWTCCNGGLFRCPCDPALYTEQTALTAAIENGPLTDEDKKRIAIEEAKKAMQLAMHGVVKSSASFEEGSRNGWWKGSVLKQKAKEEESKAGAQALPSGDWLCQSYGCDRAVNFKKNAKCFKCGAAKRF